MRRALIWLLAVPFAATSLLAGHAVAYALTGAALDTLHGYLDHAPQVVAVLVLLGLLGLAWDGRARASSIAPVASLAAIGFACQEHLEQLVHTGELPFLLTSVTFWLGLALQLPFAGIVWLVARRVAGSLARGARTRPPRPALFPFVAPVHHRSPIAAVTGGAVPGRGPPRSS